MYCAIIGDIVDSKKIANRKEAQIALGNALGAINIIYKDNIESLFTITLGDEFQGVLKSAKDVIKIIETIKQRLHPIKIRFGIGFGDIHTHIDRHKSLGADGPAYYAAREGINYIKGMEKKYEAPKQLIYVNIYGQKNKSIDLVNASLALCSQIESDWTQRQRQTIKLMIENKNLQSKVASILKVNKSNVQRSLQASKHYNYIYVIDAIDKSLNDIWEKLNAK